MYMKIKGQSMLHLHNTEIWFVTWKCKLLAWSILKTAGFLTGAFFNSSQDVGAFSHVIHNELANPSSQPHFILVHQSCNDVQYNNILKILNYRVITIKFFVYVRFKL